MAVIRMLLLVLAILGTVSVTSSLKPCPPCGDMKVPYPLSTGHDCAEPNYKLSCNNNVLSFLAVGGDSYNVLRIDPSSYKMVISNPPIEPRKCRSSDFMAEGLKIDDISPFNISNRNTVMLLNCRKILLLSPLNCSSNSLCRTFLQEEGLGGIGCRHKLCCSYLKDSSVTSHRIRVRSKGCTAYTSVVDIDPSVSPKQWSYGVELQWQPPSGPSPLAL